MKITVISTVEEIKDLIKTRIENVPNKTLIYSYVFNNDGFGQLFNLTDNPNKLVINKYNVFIPNDVIELVKDWYFLSKDYVDNLKIGDIIEAQICGSKDKIKILKFNYGKDRKENKVLTSISYEKTTQDGRTRKNNVNFKNNPTATIYWRGLKITEIRNLWEKILRGGVTFSNWDLQKFEEMKITFISL